MNVGSNYKEHYFKTTDIAHSDILKKIIHQIGCGTEPCKYQFVFCVHPDCAWMAALIQMWQNSLDTIIPTTWTRWSAAASVGVPTQWPLLNTFSSRWLPWNAISSGTKLEPWNLPMHLPVCLAAPRTRVQIHGFEWKKRLYHRGKSPVCRTYRIINEYTD